MRAPLRAIDGFSRMLEEDFAKDLEEIVAENNRDRGTTVVVVTHNVFQAKRLAQRVGLMLGGRLVEMAETKQFFDAPSDPRTAAFVRGEIVY